MAEQIDKPRKRVRRQRVVPDGAGEKFTLENEISEDEQTQDSTTFVQQKVSDGVQEETVLEEAPRRRARPADSDIQIRREQREANAELRKEKVQKQLAYQCAAILGTTCNGIAWATNHDFWRLDDVDANECGKVIAEAVPALPAKQAEALLKKIPIVNLSITLGLVFGGRIYQEMNIRKAIARGYKVEQENVYRNAPTESGYVNEPVHTNGVSEVKEENVTITFQQPGVE